MGDMRDRSREEDKERHLSALEALAVERDLRGPVSVPAASPLPCPWSGFPEQLGEVSSYLDSRAPSGACCRRGCSVTIRP
jgi:hypothetical protein